jgi:hypothetical protein
VKHTPEEHHDLPHLTDALGLVSAAALHNNEHIRKWVVCSGLRWLRVRVCMSVCLWVSLCGRTLVVLTSCLNV